jgi:hypothetical protein
MHLSLLLLLLLLLQVGRSGPNCLDKCISEHVSLLLLLLQVGRSGPDGLDELAVEAEITDCQLQPDG